ncbi:MAG: hypothetical protein ACOWWR_05510, partial [Eubacteriales bacterium]
MFLKKIVILILLCLITFATASEDITEYTKMLSGLELSEENIVYEKQSIVQYGEVEKVSESDLFNSEQASSATATNAFSMLAELANARNQDLKTLYSQGVKQLGYYHAGFKYIVDIDFSMYFDLNDIYSYIHSDPTMS